MTTTATEAATGTSSRFLLDLLIPADRLADVTALYLGGGEGKLIIQPESLTLDRPRGVVRFGWRQSKDVPWARLERPLTAVLGVELKTS